jgi:DNA/RNA endonuclease YhcR with UshA esterase domain
MLRMSLRALALAVPAAFLLALAAAPASAVQRTVTIYQIQDTTSVGHVVEGSTDTVTTTGVITGADTRPTGFGFYIQDPAGGNFSGVLVFTGGANVFADSGYARGDLITVTGRVIEFNGETEVVHNSGNGFNGVPVTAKVGTAALPAFIPIATYGNIAETAAYQFAERYEGVLVSIANAKTVRNTGVGTNQWLTLDNAIPASTDSVRVDGQTLTATSVTAPAINVVATSVRGVAYQRLPRGYGIQLRDNADIVVPSPPVLLNAWARTNTSIRLLFDRALDPVTSQNVANYARTTTANAIDAATLVGGAGSQTVDLTTTSDPQIPGEPETVTAQNVRSALNVPMVGTQIQGFRAGVTPIQMVQTNTAQDSSQFVNQQVTVRGIVSARDEQLYYMQDGTATNPSSGIAVFAPIQAMAEGDDVTVSGVITEFGGGSQLTEYSGLDYQFENATGVAKHAPVVVPPGAIGPLTGVEPFPGERYEAMLVQLNSVTVVQDSLPNGMFLVRGAGGAGDTVRVDDSMFRHQHLFSHGANLPTVVPFLRGVVNDAFGAYTVNPRDSADISDQLVGVEPGAAATAFAIRSLAPTPVSFARGGAVRLGFSMPSAGRVSARVFDLAGREVARPFTDREFAAGPQSLALDARSLGGGRVGSGIFFLQLQLENRVATAKLVVTD